MCPKVSVCVPTYNRAATLGQTIQAILNQTFVDWELIICDDMSSDDTKDVVSKFKDSRIRYYCNKTNLGLYPNWHKGISLANGEYIVIYHDHDIYLPTILERSVALLDRYPSASFVHTAWLAINGNDEIVDLDIRAFPELVPGQVIASTLAMSWASPIMAATVMTRRKTYEQVGLFRYAEYGLGCDMDMWLRLCQVGDMAYVEEPQALIRTRSRGQATNIFRWSEIVAGTRMHQDHLAHVFRENRFQDFIYKAKFIYRRDTRFLAMGIRAILFELPEIVQEGEEVIRAECNPLTSLLYTLVQHSVLLQKLLEKTWLRLHHQRVGRYLALRQRQAVEYLQSNSDLRQSLSVFGL